MERIVTTGILAATAFLPVEVTTGAMTTALKLRCRALRDTIEENDEALIDLLTHRVSKDRNIE